MYNTHCLVQGCKTTLFNKSVGVSLHPIPTSKEIRNKWLGVLKNRCLSLDWSKSRICSRHFENRFYDSQRRLKDNAVPTLFPIDTSLSVSNTDALYPQSRVDKLLSDMTQTELVADIKMGMRQLKEPLNLTDFMKEDLKFRSDSPLEAKLWIMLKKQNHLNTRLLEQAEKNKKQLEVLEKSQNEVKSAKKETEHTIDSLKYLVKSLQEKNATLEEQIEILTAVESR